MPYRNNKPQPVITEPSPEQHIIPNKTPILNILIQMKNDKKDTLKLANLPLAKARRRFHSLRFEKEKGDFG